MSIPAADVPNQAIGRRQLVALKTETAIGVFPDDATGYTQAKFLTFNITKGQDRTDRSDKREFRNAFERIAGKKSNTFDSECYMLTPAAAGSPPDINKMLITHGFAETVNVGVSVDYDMTDAVNTFALISDTGNLGEFGYGGIVQELKFSLDGSAPSKISMSGMLSDAARAGCDIILVTTTSGAGPKTIEPTDINLFQPGAIVQKLAGISGADNNAGVGMGISSADYTAGTFVTPSTLGVAWEAGDTIAPLIPDTATTGEVLSGIIGSIDIGGFSLCVVSAEITSSLEVDDDRGCYGADTYSNIFATNQKVSFSMKAYATKDQLAYLVNGPEFLELPITLKAGTAAPDMWTFYMPRAELDVSKIDVPEVNQVMIDISGVALDTATGNEALKVTVGA